MSHPPETESHGGELAAPERRSGNDPSTGGLTAPEPHAAPDVPTVAELAEMDTEQAMIAGATADGVFVEHRRNRFPVPGTKTEKRAEMVVAGMFFSAFLAMVAFVVVFVAVPYKWHLPQDGSQTFKYYTPLLGGLLGVALFGVGVGAVLWAKWLMPEEEVVQDRHDGPSSEADQLMTVATLKSGLADTGLARRSLLKSSLGLAGGALGIVPLVALVGALIKKPGRKLDTTLFSKGTPIVYSDGRRVSPGDLQAGGIATVFPGVAGGVKAADSPTLLIRLRPDQTIKPRRNQANYGWGDYVAYSKICTHAGCPASLYEQQTSRLLCPCHQSQFDVLLDAKPVFGPATRSLPRLPLGVEKGPDGKDYFISLSDYTEAIGPAFWERG
ncbi:MAG: Rieske (2Fe-2S) protein [Actinomycetota bacterium]|nr:Rieske (2Fe-2S) protein [Actinomycetota bacterium]